MINLAIVQTVLAQPIDRFREMGSGLRGERAKVDVTELIWLFGVLLIVVFFVAILARALAKQDRRAKYNSPWGLFRSLCQAHELDRSQRRLLKSLVREHQTPRPAQVFLEPDWFVPANLSSAMRARSSELAAVAGRIFAEPPAGSNKDSAADRKLDALIDA